MNQSVPVQVHVTFSKYRKNLIFNFVVQQLQSNCFLNAGRAKKACGRGPRAARTLGNGPRPCAAWPAHRRFLLLKGAGKEGCWGKGPCHTSMGQPFIRQKFTSSLPSSFEMAVICIGDQEALFCKGPDRKHLGHKVSNTTAQLRWQRETSQKRGTQKTAALGQQSFIYGTS